MTSSYLHHAKVDYVYQLMQQLMKINQCKCKGQRVMTDLAQQG